MYQFTKFEMQTLILGCQQCIQDASCLDAWVDSLEYEVKQYISPKAFSAFRGFVNSILKNQERQRTLLKSKEEFLDL